MKSLVRFAVALVLIALPSVAIGQDRFFDSNGVRIHFIEQGSGEPVVLVHGYAGTAEGNWVTPGVFQQLATHYRVIALDCRGHGKSDKPHDAKQYGQEMALDVVRLLDHLKIQKAHIVGYSMGGGITLRLLTMKPERFLTATLGGNGGRLSYGDEERRRDESIAAEMEKGSVRTLVLSLWPTDQPPPTEEQLKQSGAKLVSTQDLLALAAVRRANGDQIVTAEQVAAIAVPTMAIVGSADPRIENVNILKKAMPQLKVVAIEGATHMGARGAYTRPEFIQALQDFMKAHSTSK